MVTVTAVASAEVADVDLAALNVRAYETLRAGVFLVIGIARVVTVLAVVHQLVALSRSIACSFRA